MLYTFVCTWYSEIDGDALSCGSHVLTTMRPLRSRSQLWIPSLMLFLWQKIPLRQALRTQHDLKMSSLMKRTSLSRHLLVTWPWAVFEVDQIINSIAQEQSARATADDFTIPEPEWTREAIYHLSRVLRRRWVIVRLIESFIRLLKKISYSNSRWCWWRWSQCSWSRFDKGSEYPSCFVSRDAFGLNRRIRGILRCSGYGYRSFPLSRVASCWHG